MPSTHPLYLANQALDSPKHLEVFNKFDGKLIARVAKADTLQLEQALQAAAAAAPAMARLRPDQRQAVLEQGTEAFIERREELAHQLCLEAGKPIRDAEGEVQRLIDTFKYAAAEAVRLEGETLNLQISPRAAGYRGFTQRVPIGPCAFITPFNFPLNLVAHKVAPALAAGCPFILKPASLTPIGALIIGEVLASCELPPGAFSILPMDREDADALITDERLNFLSFTGSDQVGWELKQRAGKKKVTLELGGNAACLVDRDTDLDDCVDRLITGAFYQSGQSCISVQRILAHETILPELRDKLVKATRELKSGDPLDRDTFIGPMISEDAAKGLEAKIEKAREAGSTRLCGGQRQGAMLQATLLENVPRGQDLIEEEAFGPVAVLESFSDFDQALAEVNRSRFGLQCGIFTKDINRALHAWDQLEVGGLVIGDVPSWRVDHMPYGGVKDSGIGREGLKYAIEEMSELRSLIIRQGDHA